MTQDDRSLQRQPNEDMNTDRTRVLSQFILKQHRIAHGHSAASPSHSPRPRPLIVGLQGPQGIGKTTVTNELQNALAEPPHNLKVAVFSIDDLYLTHKELKELERTHPDNRLLHGRGQPGTHDVSLGKQVLESLRQINDTQTSPTPKAVLIPAFDKSRHGGEGDRVEQDAFMRIAPPLDIVLFEGWCLGFRSIGEEAMREVYTQAQARAKAKGPEKGTASSSEQQPSEPYFLQHSLESLLSIDKTLRAYERDWYPLLDAFIELRPVTTTDSSSSSSTSSDEAFTQGLQNIFTWRLQAEHAMKAKNGGQGMTDEQVRAFVERYMPGYEIWGRSESSSGDGGGQKGLAWQGRRLRVDVGPTREVVDVYEL